jgi:phenylpyruvate tautomerase PptA (4-oxalocrotonate tautomerase family)
MIHSFNEVNTMPLVRIDLIEGTPSDYRRGIVEEIYNAMTKTMNVPENDCFQLVTEREPEHFIVDPTYLGIQRSPKCVIIQITLNKGRTVEAKQAFYRAVADRLHERVGLRREDVFINLVEVDKENWSFGNGVAQYA